MKVLRSLCFAVPAAALAVASVLSTPARADYVKISAISTCSKDSPGHVAIGFYSDNMMQLGTVAVWNNTPPVRTNTDFDWNLIYRERNGGCGKIASRWARVSPERRKWLQYEIATSTGTGCKKYVEIAGTPIDAVFTALGKSGGTCSCVNFGTRVWRNVTADRERWSIAITPTKVYNEIFSANGGKTSGWLDGGKEWK
jgi:hypothetical protein